MSDPAVAPFTVWPVGGTEATARSYVAATEIQAAELAARDDYADEDEWSIAYCVRDGLTGQIWEVRVGVAAQPSFVALEARKIQMSAATHVMWGGHVLCKDLRLRGVPRDWPANQRWISLKDVADGAKAPPDRCESCWNEVPSMISGLRQIGVN